MKRLKYLIVLMLLISFTPVQSQVVVHDKTDSNVSSFVKAGLSHLDVDSVHIIIMELNDDLYNKFRKPGHELRAVTLAKDKNTYVLLLGEPTNSTLLTLVSHELIHIEQNYNNKRHSEQEAYSNQVMLSQHIRKITN